MSPLYARCDRCPQGKSPLRRTPRPNWRIGIISQTLTACRISLPVPRQQSTLEDRIQLSAREVRVQLGGPEVNLYCAGFK